MDENDRKIVFYVEEHAREQFASCLRAMAEHPDWQPEEGAGMSDSTHDSTHEPIDDIDVIKHLHLSEQDLASNLVAWLDGVTYSRHNLRCTLDTTNEWLVILCPGVYAQNMAVITTIRAQMEAFIEGYKSGRSKGIREAHETIAEQKRR